MDSFSSKVLLFGEYSTLYKSMALVIPYDRFSGQLAFDTKGDFSPFATQSNEYLKKFSGFIASHLDDEFVLEVKRFEWEIANGLFFKSDIPQGAGLGSSGALIAAIFLRYMVKAKYVKDELKLMTAETLQKLKLKLAEMESFFHGSSSGLDPLSIILNHPILYTSADDVTAVHIPKKNENGKNVIFLLNTGIERQTSKLVTEFANLCKADAFKEKVHGELTTYTNDSIHSFLNEDTRNLYKNLEKLIHFQLDEMSYFIPSAFRKPITTGLDNGDYFLKICGAGGGGYMLGFTENWTATQEQLLGYDLEVIHQY